MDTEPTPLPPAPPIHHDGRPGFIADLGFTVIVPWLMLWRFELPDGPGRSMWAGWWPVVVVAALLVIVLIIGAVQRSPRGFLPYNVRWALLAATLILPAWIALSLADAPDRPTTIRAAATQLREVAGKSENPAVRDAVASSEKLAEVLEQVESQGKEIPQKPIPGTENLTPETRKTFEQTHAIADAIDSDQPLPTALDEAAADAGIEEAEVLAALLAVAALLLAPMLGISTDLTLVLLKGLFAAGKLTLGSMVRLVATLEGSTLPDGSLDEVQVRENFERYEELGRNVDIIVAAAEEHGADVDDSKLAKLRKPADESDAPDLAKLKSDCRKLMRGQSGDLTNQMSRRCPNLSPSQISQLAAELQRGASR